MPLPLSHTRNITAAPTQRYISSRSCIHVHTKQTSPPLLIVVAGIQNSMGQGAAKAKQGGEEAAAQKPEKKDEKKAHKSNDADALIAFMKKHYDDKVKDVKTFDEFYHAIYELIEMFCEQHGQLQYRIPAKEELRKQYDMAHPSGSANLTPEQFEKIATGILKIDSFTFGKAAVDILAFLFGLPVCALLAKRVVPGLKAISDDIVIPAATSGAVIYLAKSNKL